MYVAPTRLEMELARTLVTAIALEWRNDPLADASAIVSNALAQCRARTEARLIGMLDTLVQQSGHITDDQIEAFKRGWTPQQVHALVAAHAALKTDLHRARLLAGT